MGIPVLWRTKNARYSLQGQVCQECERVVFPPRRRCPYCGEVHCEQARQQEHEAKTYHYSFVLPQSAGLQSAGDD